jgi:D-lactate dehydrogenase (cytochrome)
MIVKTDRDVIGSYLHDESGLLGAHCDKVIIPETYEEVSCAIKEASSNNIPVSVSGAGTGVTGGRLPFGGMVVSLEKLDKILNISPGSMTVQAGVPITKIHEAAASVGHFYPPDATEWDASIGGNISTNASGSRSFKYGPTRKYVDSIKVVLANGEIIDVSRGQYLAKGQTIEILNPKSKILNKFQIPNIQIPNIKNAAGYYSRPDMDLIDLFIGSEGTLGIIVEARLLLLPASGYVFAAFAFFDKNENALGFVTEARNADALAIEYFDKNSLDMLRSRFPKIPSGREAAIFFEEEITPDKEDSFMDKWAALLEKYGVNIENVWGATEPEKELEFKKIRHELPVIVNEIVRSRGIAKVGTDIAVPFEKFPEMFSIYTKELSASGMDHLIFGHIGDNHLHANILPKNEAEMKKAKEIYLRFAKAAVSLGGTVSAEHGIGKLKHAFLREMYGDKGLMEMARVKKTLDPKGILGRGNIFPEELLGQALNPNF